MHKLIRWCIPLVIAFFGLVTPGYADFVRIEQDHVSVRYEGDWRTVSGAAVSGGTVRVASAVGARVHVSFRGPGISVVGYRCECAQGNAWAYVDGVRRAMVSPVYSSTPEAQSAIYTIDGLGAGPHVLTLELTAENGQGSNDNFVVDAFDIRNGAPLRRIEENDPAIRYTGTWMDIDDPSVSGGSVLATQELGATATLRFSGNSLQWINYGCPCAGGIVTIDVAGMSFGPLSSLSSTRQPQRATTLSIDLPDGEHEMNLRVTGTTPDAPSWVVIDAFAVDATTGDTTAPDVTLTAPGNATTVTGLVTFEATAQDNVGVTRVQYYADPEGGRAILLGEDTSAPYSLTRDTNGIPSGSRFRLWARAWDANSNYEDSASATVTVTQTGDTTPPVVAITAPAANSTVSGLIDLVATASDDRQVDTVRFVIDVLSRDHIMTMPIRQPPYTMQLDTLQLKDGQHRIYATARDLAGNTSTAEIMITVDNSVQPNSVRVDDTHPAIVYSGGTWTRESDGSEPRFHWDAATYASTVGATVTGTFQGTGLRWHGFTCEYCGVASVSIDGGPAQTVDTYIPNAAPPEVEFGSVIYSSPALASGTHTVTITMQPSPPHRTRPERVYIDAFEILR